MASISSVGIGSNLDVKSIVSQLVALEKQPLKTLEIKATLVQGQISAVGQIQSQFTALADAATAISTASAWTARTASSSNTSAASISVTSTAAATSFTLDVDSLAKQQSVSSATVAAGASVGAGQLTLRLGAWTGPDAVAAAAAAAAGEAATALAADNDAASALTTFAITTPSAAAYAAAYGDWVAAIAANDHVTAGLQTAEADALTALNTAQSDLSTADPTALADAGALPAVVTANLSDASALKGAAIAAANAAATGRPTFSANGSSSDVTIDVTASDTVATIAGKINAANAGVVATAFFDGTQDRLMLRSKDTGVAAGFRLTANDTVDNGGGALTGTTGLARLAFDPSTGAFGAATAGNTVQSGEDAKARINGMAVTSSSNTLTGNIPGVTITLSATTTTNYGLVNETKSPVTMGVSEDVTPAVKNVQNFVTAYNALIANLSDLTKFDAATKTAGAFQGDSSVVGLLSVLRNMVGSVSSGSVFQRLSDVGLEVQRNGTLSLNTTKLSAAANNGTELQKMFITNNGNDLTNGFALKFSKLAKGVLATGGAVTNKTKALQDTLARNAQDQTKVNDRASAFEARLNKQYSALDARMASLNALNAYVSQQVTTWNKSGG